MKRIISKSAYNSGRVTKNKQDGSREFITLLACISACGRSIPATLLYKGASGDLQNTWVDAVTAEDECYFGSTQNGWSTNKIGLSWLEKVFERHTKPSNPQTKRLLLVDGHSSYVNIKFINWADRHSIIILILPPHTTHKLQPLNVGLFQPLSTAYSKELDDLMVASGGLVSMTKRMFYPMFLRAWRASFTKSNICHAWAKTGLWPFDPPIVLNSIKQPERVINELIKGVIKTPKSSKSLRRFKLAYCKSPSLVKVDILLDANQRLATTVDILQFENRGLRQAIILKQNKRKRGKKLNLAGQESLGAELYFPNKVVQARLY